jgi:phospholipase C
MGKRKKAAPGTGAAPAGKVPVSKVVIFFMENHTTDNVASGIPGVKGDPSLPTAPDVVIPDPPHDHHHWMMRKDPPPHGWRRGRFTAAELPTLNLLMKAFTVCDNYFSDYAGNSFPNHAFAIGADAEWAFTNPSHYQFTIKTPGVPVRLAKGRKTWANYGKGFAFAHYADKSMHGNVKTQAQFLADAKAGNLPNVSWVYGPPHKDFHPGPLTRPEGSSMKASDAWLRSAVKAVATGKDWPRVVIFITFDDWGGWYDQVVPPLVEKFPKSAATPFTDEQYRYGSRVPCIVVGPYAKARHVCHDLGSHVSLVAFIEWLFGLPPSPNADAKRRTAADKAMLAKSCCDFAQTPLKPPPL